MDTRDVLGTRGSVAQAGTTTLRFGGSTSCVSVRSDAGTQLVIDCGTGAHGLGHQLLAEANGEPVDGHILISHTHWDHIAVIRCAFREGYCGDA